MLRAKAMLILLGIRQASKMARQLQEMLEDDAAAKAKVIKEQEIKICGMARQVKQFETLVADLEAEKREAFLLLEEDLEREKSQTADCRERLYLAEQEVKTVRTWALARQTEALHASAHIENEVQSVL